MAIIASGLYGLTLEKFFTDGAGTESLEAEDNKCGLVTDTEAPNFDTHDFHADLLAEITGGNYAKEPVDTTEITLATGVLTWDANDALFDNAGANDVTITDAMAAVMWTEVGTSATDQLIGLWDFVTAASCTNSTFTVQWNASGLVTLDYTP
jgi:hypothetical protein